MSINENMWVEKSRFLLGMQAPSYELGELKVLDTYLARINARDPKTKLVKFTKGEYESLMGLKQIKPQQLKKHTQSLLGKVVTIPYGDRGYDQYTLFTHARCKQDPDTLEWTVELGCNEKLEPVFFNLESAGYLRYRLKNIVPLTSKYSVLLYLYLKDNIFRESFAITLEELKERLEIIAPRYDSFKYLRAEILDKCISEINNKTDITASYERKTRGRLTVGLIFTVKGKAAMIEKLDDMEQISFEEIRSSEPSPEGGVAGNVANSKTTMFKSVIKNGDYFTDEQIEDLIATAKTSSWYIALPFHLMPVIREQLLLEYFQLQERYTRARVSDPNDAKKFAAYFRKALKENYAEVRPYEEKPTESFDTDDFFDAAIKKSYG